MIFWKKKNRKNGQNCFEKIPAAKLKVKFVRHSQHAFAYTCVNDGDILRSTTNLFLLFFRFFSSVFSFVLLCLSRHDEGK